MTLTHVDLTRAELGALLETVELTLVFDGRTEAREAIEEAIAAHNRNVGSPLCIEEGSLAVLAQRTVRIDYSTSVLRSKLDRALRR